MFSDLFTTEVLERITLANTGALKSMAIDNPKQVGMVIYNKEATYLKDEAFILSIIVLMTDFGAADEHSRIFVEGDKKEWLSDTDYFGIKFEFENQLLFMKEREVISTISLDNLYSEFLYIKNSN